MKVKKKKMEKVLSLTNPNPEYLSVKRVTISIPNGLHKKLTQLGWILQTDKRSNLNVITYNIIDSFIEENKDEIIELQNSKINIF